MNLDTSKPIKSVSYNGVDVPVYNAPDNPVLLWTNASPTSGFAAQTLSLPAGYDAYLVEVRYSYGVSRTTINYLPLSASTQYIMAENFADRYNYVNIRNVTSVKSGSISFGDARPVSTSSASSTYSDYAVPTRIWGVKFTL